MSERRPDPDPEPSRGWGASMGTVGEYMVVAFVFPIALALGFFVGRWVGELLGGPLAGAVVGVLLGTAAGFYNLWETMQRIAQREERERAEREDRAP